MKLKKVTQQEPHRWDVHFWHAMVYASLEQDADAIEEVKQALKLGLPPILLTPLDWYKQSRPDFYEQHVKPLTSAVLHTATGNDG